MWRNTETLKYLYIKKHLYFSLIMLTWHLTMKNSFCSKMYGFNRYDLECLMLEVWMISSENIIKILPQLLGQFTAYHSWLQSLIRHVVVALNLTAWNIHPTSRHIPEENVFGRKYVIAHSRSYGKCKVEDAYVTYARSNLSQSRY